MTQNTPSRLAVLGCGHVVKLFVMHVLLETLQPEPNGFRFDTVSKAGSFAVLTLAPVLVGIGARSWAATAVVGLLHALSPLALLGGMSDPDSDLNFAILLWWFPLPALAALVVATDRFIRRPTSSTKVPGSPDLGRRGP